MPFFPPLWNDNYQVKHVHSSHKLVSQRQDFRRQLNIKLKEKLLENVKSVLNIWWVTEVHGIYCAHELETGLWGTSTVKYLSPFDNNLTPQQHHLCGRHRSSGLAQPGPLELPLCWYPVKYMRILFRCTLQIHFLFRL